MMACGCTPLPTDPILDGPPGQASSVVLGRRAEEAFRKARGLYIRGRLDEARRHAGRAIRMYSSFAEGHLLLGMADLRESRYQPALAHLGRALGEVSLADDSERVYGHARFGRALAYLALGRPKRARQDLKNAQDFPQIKTAALALRALARIQTDERAAAMADLRAAKVSGIRPLPGRTSVRYLKPFIDSFGLDLEGAAAPPPGTSERLIARASAALLALEAEYNLSEHVLETLAGQDPGDGRTWLLLGHLRLIKSNYTDADAALSRALELGAGDRANLLLNRGLARRLAGRGTEALDDFKQAGEDSATLDIQLGKRGFLDEMLKTRAFLALRTVLAP